MASVVPALTLGKKLGNGHFGEVFLGQDNVHGQIAVKVLSRDPTESPAEWDARKLGLLKEAISLSKASHPNVVQVHRIDEHPSDDSIRLCMVYCPNGSLQSHFDLGPMAIAAVRKVGTEVCLGLENLHARGMLHRDIKPGNILLDASGVAKLGDFGLVTDNLVHGYGSQNGYLDHIAYEVWHGDGTSRKSDIWALGMTLYRLLHGREWYQRMPPAKGHIKFGNFADSLVWLPHVPRSWRRVIRKMLNDDKTKRYATANQVLNALSKLETPQWAISVSTSVVRWEQQIAQRRRVVEWTELAPRKHEWHAWSEPVLGVTGRAKTLAGSEGVVSRSKALKGLEEFFEI